MTGAEPCRWLALLPAHALGAVDGEELRGLEAHLAGRCADCEAELRGLRHDVAVIGEAAPPVAPAPSTREWLLAELGTTERSPRAGRRLAAAAVVALFAAGGWWTAGLAGELERLRSERDELAAALAAAEERRALVEVELAEHARQLAVLAGPEVEQVQLAASGAEAAGSGRTFVDGATGRALFQAAGLARLPAGRVYQLWFIVDAAPISAGTFVVDGRGAARLVVEGVPARGRIQAWAVTVEPAGGRPQPTGEMVLRG